MRELEDTARLQRQATTDLLLSRLDAAPPEPDEVVDLVDLVDLAGSR